MPTVLFVDDEHRVLSGLRRMLYPYRDRWDMEFVEGGEPALGRLETDAVDVVVSDFRMPGMDGGELLRRMRHQHPHTARVILSGHADEADLVRVIRVAHRFLHKPCQPDQLIRAIDGALSMSAEVGDDRTRATVGGIDLLPCSSEALADLAAAVSEATPDVDDVVACTERSIGLASSVLHLANASVFAADRPIYSVGAALERLGIPTLRALYHDGALGGPSRGLPEAWLRRLDAHGAEVGRRAAALVDEPMRPAAFSAGVLHEAGQLILAIAYGDAFARAREEAQVEGRPLTVIERREVGTAHDAAGAYLMSLWGIPQPIVEAAFHHESAPDPDHSKPNLTVAEAVALAHSEIEMGGAGVCCPPSRGGTR